jgi:CubicO group peptidase (beta-lactamase class C family)
VEVVAVALTDQGPAAHDMTTRVAGLRRYRRLGFLTVVLALLGVVTLSMSGQYPVRLVRTDVHCGRTASGDVSGQLQCLVSDYAGQDPSVRNIELAVAKGDGSYSWAGSAGIAQQGGTAMAAGTPIYLASVTKIYIATLVMVLSQDKLLSLDDPAARYLPAGLVDGIDIYGGHDYSRQVTVRQLVSMTSGIADYYEEKGPDGKTGYDLFLADPAKTWTVAEMINRARTDLKPHFAPGTGLYYSDTNYQLLGMIIETVTPHLAGQRAAELPLRSAGTAAHLADRQSRTCGPGRSRACLRPSARHHDGPGRGLLGRWRAGRHASRHDRLPQGPE